MVETNILALIPARGGSIGVPKKNIRDLHGKPLLYYPIDDAKKSKYINKIVVTTDNQEIKQLALNRNTEVIMRPFELAQSNSLVIEAIRHSITSLESTGYLPNVIVLLECTSPIRKVEDIDKAIEILLEGKYDSVATFAESSVSVGRLWSIKEEGVKPYSSESNPFLNRQKQPTSYHLTGEVYAFKRADIMSNLSNNSVLIGNVYPIVTEKKLSIDIDDEIDFVIAESIIKHLKKL